MLGLSTITKKLGELEKAIRETKTLSAKDGKDGQDGKDGKDGRDGKDVALEDVVDKLRPDILRRFQQGTPSGNMNRNITINSSVITRYGDLNYIGSIAGVPNNTTKQTDVYFSGGGSPASPDTSVQFNDGGSFGGSSGLRFDKTTNRISIGTEAQNGGFDAPDAVTSDTVGAGMTFNSGLGNGAGAGGSMEFNSRSGGETGNGGNWSVVAGSGGDTSGSGGSISLTAGSAQGGNSDGGDITITTGTQAGTGQQGSFILLNSKVPSAANDTGTAGAIAWDSGFIYVCTATDTWKRVAIATW